ncbi:hypothetical protein GWI33_007896 [Rhynchophorus ferrugineus]|uniref:Uncharacterized protein n=1 Tax=Rhynchophorus ferrugineus TaxID=354439 RepID=A0A834IJF4_RHYFE|nr:hypothetical protein GWI33_007896 [Rhynchophorus ferrugineus]
MEVGNKRSKTIRLTRPKRFTQNREGEALTLRFRQYRINNGQKNQMSRVEVKNQEEPGQSSVKINKERIKNRQVRGLTSEQHNSYMSCV